MYARRLMCSEHPARTQRASGACPTNNHRLCRHVKQLLSESVARTAFFWRVHNFSHMLVPPTSLFLLLSSRVIRLGSRHQTRYAGVIRHPRHKYTYVTGCAGLHYARAQARAPFDGGPLNSINFTCSLQFWPKATQERCRHLVTIKMT